MKCSGFSVRVRVPQRAARAVVLRRKVRAIRAEPASTVPETLVKVKFTIPHHVEYGQSICILGGVDELGEWDVKRSPCLTWSEGDVWSGIVEIPPCPVEYKYFVKNPDGTPAEWQPCANLKVEIEGEEMDIEDEWEGEIQTAVAEMEPMEVAEDIETEEDMSIPETMKDLAEAAEKATPEPIAETEREGTTASL